MSRHEAKTISGHITDAVFDRYSIGTLRAVSLYTEQVQGTVVSLRRATPTAR